ncbi:thiolase [Rozella allomycis CSF55]|nr:thiolase [Rozella allomycis CSF55]
MSVYIVAAKRTAFGTFGGSLKEFSATSLGTISSKAALKQLPEGTPIDSVIFGNVIQSSTDAAYLARHVALRSNLPVSTPAVTINRLCGSGFESLIQGYREIVCKDSKVVLTGGAESMSQCPFVVREGRWGIKYGVQPRMEDSLYTTLIDQYPAPTPMGVTAENLASEYSIDREECDKWAVESHKRWFAANENDAFKDEIVGIEINSRKGTRMFDTDETPRKDTDVEIISKLKAIFKPDGVTTAANASGITDGAASVILASEEAVKEYKLTPLAKIISYHVAGVEPRVMGIGPVPAMKGALKKANLSLDQMDLIEVNEAFTSQFLAVSKSLKLDLDKTNVHGGAIAIGHPLAASGSRIIAHQVYNLLKTKKKYALSSACIGGGQGIAVVIERV